jgi:hypothetical protein
MSASFQQAARSRKNTSKADKNVKKWFQAISTTFEDSQESRDTLRNLIHALDPKKCPTTSPPANLCENKRQFYIGGTNFRDYQCRYLFVMCECNQVERYRRDAIALVKQCKWLDVAHQLCAATNVLNALIHDRDAWWGMMLLAKEDPTATVRDGHAIDVVELLYRNIEILRIDTGKAYATALRRMESRLQKVKCTLGPLLQNRDKVRARVGEERWKDNRQPKNDFVNMRISLETEQKQVRQALCIMNDLTEVEF